MSLFIKIIDVHAREILDSRGKTVSAIGNPHPNPPNSPAFGPVN